MSPKRVKKSVSTIGRKGILETVAIYVLRYSRYLTNVGGGTFVSKRIADHLTNHPNATAQNRNYKLQDKHSNKDISTKNAAYKPSTLTKGSSYLTSLEVDMPTLFIMAPYSSVARLALRTILYHSRFWYSHHPLPFQILVFSSSFTNPGSDLRTILHRSMSSRTILHRSRSSSSHHHPPFQILVFAPSSTVPDPGVRTILYRSRSSSSHHPLPGAGSSVNGQFTR